MKEELEENADLIVDGLWLGRKEAGAVPLDVLKKHNITHVFVPAMIQGYDAIKYPEDLEYVQWYIADLSGWPILPLFDKGTEIISAALNSGGGILVHCNNGVSRSASFVAAYIMRSQNLSAGAAFATIRDKRKQVNDAKFQFQLNLYGKMNNRFDTTSAAYAEAKAAGIAVLHKRNRDCI
eukprot:TRINITY_DN7572_c0_g1_i1.p2 TRINITY_DN7572_c0_g1~~TRINITY_DN7572_c0_g1_i1.p2  ORF type:complete len:180 (-),score=39.98 TRINITY_DN7572_c0_g1_i1:632-1171(-)